MFPVSLIAWCNSENKTYYGLVNEHYLTAFYMALPFYKIVNLTLSALHTDHR